MLVGVVVMIAGVAALIAAGTVRASRSPQRHPTSVRAPEASAPRPAVAAAKPAPAAVARTPAPPTAPAAVSVRTSGGRPVSPAGVVSFQSVSREDGSLVFRGVSVLGGQVSAERVVVPDDGFASARVDGLRVDGRPRRAGPNALYPLRAGGYVVVLQEAVAGARQGLVGLRVHTTHGLGARHVGGDVLVGVPSGRGGRSSVLALGPAQAPTSTGSDGYPLAVRGVVVGCPFVPGSTHSPTAPPDNLASDNAVDLAVPVGTPVLAVADGTIGPLIGPLDSTDPHMAGLRVHLDTPADHYYYAHLSRLDVTPGERVVRGQVIGLSGEAAGVAHLHFAQDLGDPARTVGESLACPLRPRPRERWG
jgi:murein DD-endopeptidase MepM/ murein hydrolase activator NlpD